MKDGGVRITSEMTIEVEGGERPAMVAETMGVVYAWLFGKVREWNPVFKGAVFGLATVPMWAYAGAFSVLLLACTAVALALDRTGFSSLGLAPTRDRIRECVFGFVLGALLFAVLALVRHHHLHDLGLGLDGLVHGHELLTRDDPLHRVQVRVLPGHQRDLARARFLEGVDDAVKTERR